MALTMPLTPQAPTARKPESRIQLAPRQDIEIEWEAGRQAEGELQPS